MIHSKGIANIPSQILILLIAAGLVAAVYFLWIENYIDVKVIVSEFQVERRAINLAQAMLSHEKLAYNDGERFYRAMFDKEKLDRIMVKGAVNPTVFLSANSELSNLAYPDSVAYIVVQNLETGEVWSAMLSGPVTLQGTSYQNFIACMTKNLKIDFGSIFRIPSGPLAAWDVWDLQKCTSLIDKKKYENFFASQSDITQRGFPVAIRSGDEINVGRIHVGLMEWL